MPLCMFVSAFPFGEHHGARRHHQTVGQLRRGELGEDGIGPGLGRLFAAHGAVQRGVQQYVQMLEIGGFAQGASEGVAVHFAHFDVGDDHVDFLRGALQFKQHVDGVLGAARGVAFDAEVAQGVHRLLQGHLAVVHHQDVGGGQQAGVFLAQGAVRRLGHRRGDGMDDFFDVQHLYQGVVDPGHAGDERAAARAVGWWFDVGAQAMHDAADRLHMQTLARAADLGDDQAAAVRVSQRPFADGAGQVDDRQRITAQGRHAFHVGVRLGQLGQRRAGNYLADLEQVDCHQLAAAQGEQQQGQRIRAGILRGHGDLRGEQGITGYRPVRAWL